MKCETCGSTNIDPKTNVCGDCGTKYTGAAGNAAAGPDPAAGSGAATTSATTTTADEGDNDLHPEITVCPVDQGGCGAKREKITPFCKVCRFDFRHLQPGKAAIGAAATPPADPVAGGATAAASAQPAAAPAPERQPAVSMKALVSIDPDYFAWCLKNYDGIDDIKLPDPLPPATSFVLKGEVVLIGRASRSLKVQPTVQSNNDVGVSKKHCKLVLQDDGTYSLFHGQEPGADENYVCDDDNGTRLNDDLDNPVPKDSLTPIKVGDVLRIGFWTRIEIQAN